MSFFTIKTLMCAGPNTAFKYKGRGRFNQNVRTHFENEKWPKSHSIVANTWLTIGGWKITPENEDFSNHFMDRSFGSTRQRVPKKTQVEGLFRGTIYGMSLADFTKSPPEYAIEDESILVLDIECNLSLFRDLRIVSSYTGDPNAIIINNNFRVPV